jgi:rhamnosyltransferase
VTLGEDQGQRKKTGDTGEDVRPDVSIIIPCYNGGESIRKTLQAVLAQRTSRPFEVLVIDSGSSAETIDILRTFPVRLDRIPHEEFHHGRTRDRGARLARGQTLVFLNQDARPGTDTWLDLLLEPFDRSGDVLAVQARVREPEDAPGFFWDSCPRGFSYTCETREWTRRYRGIGFSTVNCAVRRSVWEREPFGAVEILEDKAWQARIHLTGDEIVFSDAWVFHAHDFTYAQLKKRVQDEGFGWRLVGVSYSLGHLFRDLFRWRKYVELFQGLVQGRVKSVSEILFPVVRPLWLYKGNRWNRGLLKS